MAVGVRANAGFRVWDAEAAWPSGVTLRLVGGFPCLGRSPRTEAFVGGARKRHYVRFGPAALALIEPRHESRIPPHGSHISCPIRAASPRAPPREPSRARGAYPALDAARRRTFRREF